MRLRGMVHQLKRLRNEDRPGFRLRDGSFYRYDFQRAGGELWAYCINLMVRVEEGDEPPEEPEILTMIRAAKNPKAAIEPFRPDNRERAFVDPGLLLQDDPETSEDRF